MFWLVFFIIYVIGLAYVNYYSVFGYWISTWNETVWQGFNVYDPETTYLISGIEFFKERYSCFHGHPGLPLMLSIQLIAKLYYFLTSPFVPGGVGYYPFLAKNFFNFIFLCKFFSIFVNFISFIVLYRLARRLLEPLWAKIAVITYATSFSLLYISSKIMPESLMVLFVFLALDFMWRFYEQIEMNNIKNSFLFLMGSSFFIVSAIFVKIMIVAPLICLFFLALLLQRKTFNLRKPIELSLRFKSFLIFGLSTIILFLAWSYKLNWEYFLKMWFNSLPGGIWSPTGGTLQFNEGKNLILNYSSSFGNAVFSYSHMLLETAKTFFSGFGRNIHPTLWFLLFEGLFFAASIYGMINLFKEKHPAKSAYSRWVLTLNILLLPVMLYKWEFHYFVLTLGFFSLYFSYFLMQLLNRCNLSKGKLFSLGICFILIVNSPSLIANYFIKKRDIIIYCTNFKKYRDALNTIDYQGKIGHYSNRSLDTPTGLIRNYPLVNEEKRDIFYQEFIKYFIFLEKKPSEDEMKNQSIQVIIS